jgi:hypothetical protein
MQSDVDSRRRPATEAPNAHGATRSGGDAANRHTQVRSSGSLTRDREGNTMTEHARPKIAPRRVQTAFGDEAANVEPMIVIDAHGDRLTLRTVDGKARVGTVAYADAFATALDRPDLTRIRGEHPFLLVNVRRRLIALAFGPVDLPDKIRMLANVVRLEAGSAVEIPGDGDGQPSWLLFEADVV